jgi:cytochrome d ubiquinol oxidase subunit II
MVLSAAFGLASLLLLTRRAFLIVRGTAALAVVCALWAWGIAQYPTMLEPGVTLFSAAAAPATLAAVAAGLGAGGVLVLPSLVVLYALFQRSAPERGRV